MDCSKLDLNGAHFSYSKNDIPTESAQFSLDDYEEFSTTLKCGEKSLTRELLLPTTTTTTTSAQNHNYTSISLTEMKKPTNRNNILNGTKNENLSLVNNENNANEAHLRVFPIKDNNNSVSENFREESRLTDEIELDGDSGSDDGLILPTLTSSNNNSNNLTQTISNKLLNGIRHLKRLFFCCTPHWIPPKLSFLRSNL